MRVDAETSPELLDLVEGNGEAAADETKSDVARRREVLSGVDGFHEDGDGGIVFGWSGGSPL